MNIQVHYNYMGMDIWSSFILLIVGDNFKIEEKKNQITAYFIRYKMFGSYDLLNLL